MKIIFEDIFAEMDHYIFSGVRLVRFLLTNEKDFNFIKESFIRGNVYISQNKKGNYVYKGIEIIYNN